jgi:hypothetical protein
MWSLRANRIAVSRLATFLNCLIRGPEMQKKKTFSTMEIVLLGVLVGSLILSFIQGRQEERQRP